jgi:5-oxopent-3-ene-1,2,5-tricarboxylate decarboxylase/2-hydroxyhepta-2,4-diene-1,7-dioate isomerase
MLVNGLLLNPLRLDGLPPGMAGLGLSGVVYGVVGNDPRLLAAIGEAMHQPPYKAPPVAPVLHAKPRNTLVPSGAAVALPAAGGELGACLGLVIGRTACRVPAAQALAHVAGYLAVADLALPQPSYYRPNLRAKARDGSCVLGARLTPAGEVADPDALAVRVQVDGVLVQADATSGRTRGAARLLADVSAFMTLRPGDVLLLGASHPPVAVRPGQAFTVEIEGLAAAAGRVVAQGAQA